MRSWLHPRRRALLRTSAEDIEGRLPLSVAVECGLAEVGRGTYGEPTIVMFRGPKTVLRIGRYCSIAPDVVILINGAHRTDWLTTYPVRAAMNMAGAFEDGHPAVPGKIEISNDVWIGFGARVLPGVSIGDGAVVGAGSWVASDVRPYAVVAGNPAVELRRRFSDDVIRKLLRMKWWHWPEERIRDNAELLCGVDPSGLDSLAAIAPDDTTGGNAVSG